MSRGEARDRIKETLGYSAFLVFTACFALVVLAVAVLTPIMLYLDLPTK